MKFTPQAVDGVVLVELEPHVDERGFFSRSFAAEEFEAHGMISRIVHANTSFNHRAGTLRGLHSMVPPYAESKFVRCTRGAILDVVVDIRPDSTTYLQHVAVELSADNHASLYLPPHVAHAYQTLVDDTEVLYLVSHGYVPGAEVGFRHDDPAFGLTWPLPVSLISDKDASWPDFDSATTTSATTTSATTTSATTTSATPAPATTAVTR